MKIRRAKGRQAALISGTALPLVLAAGVATAQTAPAPTTARVEEVVVTAQKRSQNIQAVPVTIQAFGAKTINDLGIKSSPDIAAFTPNVSIALPAGAGNQPIIAIRGIGLNDYDTNNAGPNGIYVDEVYLSSPAGNRLKAFIDGAPARRSASSERGGRSAIDIQERFAQATGAREPGERGNLRNGQVRLIEKAFCALHAGGLRNRRGRSCKMLLEQPRQVPGTDAQAVGQRFDRSRIKRAFMDQGQGPLHGGETALPGGAERCGLGTAT
jgi:hypothetical protein